MSWPVPGWQTVLMSVLLAASCLGGSGQDFGGVKTNLSHLLFLKSSPAGEPLNLELVVRCAVPCPGDYEPPSPIHAH